MKNNVHENSLFANQKTDKLKDKEKILNAMKEGFQTVAAIMAWTEIPLVTLRARLSDLKKGNKIIPVGIIRNGNDNPEAYYRLAKPGERNNLKPTPSKLVKELEALKKTINLLAAEPLKDCECNPNTSLTEIFYLSS